jgi:hypothetical protein
MGIAESRPGSAIIETRCEMEINDEVYTQKNIKKYANQQIINSQNNKIKTFPNKTIRVPLKR